MYLPLRTWGSTLPGSGISRSLPRVVLAALLGWMMFATIGQTSRLDAQEVQPGSQGPARPAASGAEAQQSQQAAAKNEAKEADATEAFRHSSAVRFIARLTGLSLDQAYWSSVVLNFAIVLVLVWMGLRKVLPGVFKNRSEAIRQGIEEARKTSEEARRRLTEVEGRLSRLDVEIAEMRRHADENAGAEEKRILAETEEERRRIVASAEQEIALAASAARRDLKSYAAELAVELAGKKIQVGKDTDRALVREFTARLGKDGN